MNYCVVDAESLPSYLRSEGSLTRTFKTVCGGFHIEQKRFKRNAPFYTRECLLLDNGRPLVWARSFLFSTHNETIETFCHLGSQSLGERLLFASENRSTNKGASSIEANKATEGTLARGPYTFFEVNGADPELQAAMGDEAIPTVNYGRSSQFTWSHHDSVLFLSEVFSPYAEAVLV
ncbi:chorismate--pyruvate lyase family protein [Photobacterium sanguinicancri]|uniref:chorismate--pyruvate lyase family protein n=1 Tax=Photobacterium sanguinicancri TaxID=875932 RepID=UPI0024802634|nr:hypothetical protein [Photobacterium sanguinicancri]